MPVPTKEQQSSDLLKMMQEWEALMLKLIEEQDLPAEEAFQQAAQMLDIRLIPGSLGQQMTMGQGSMQQQAETE